ncbi:M48 family metallopeptidase [Pelomonas sp. Root1217]|uniref:M48 family metallopeptidase n=1 Tax=Pelomonas sp. Root1217 TaxID=1736430 RepID=UPI00070F717C|nr:M48 family metallopeptidase [Pelomonas sp. Root1217]
MKRGLTTAAAWALGLALTTAHGQDTNAASAPTAATQAQKADAIAQASSFRIRPVDDAWRAALPRDAEAATQAYMDRLPADVLAKSAAYWEGGYWMQLWDLLLGLGIAALMLSGRRAARVRDWAARVGRGPVRRDMLFGATYLLAAWALSLPLSIYTGFVREQAYGMSTQTFWAWAGEQFVSLAVNLALAAVVFAVLYAVIRRTGERWWIWGTVLGIALLAFMIALSPVFIEPLFNTYKPVEDGPVKAAVLRMAHANGVPVDNVYEFDASRQTTRISANVTGLFGTAAVRLNDNLLRRTSEAEIRAVMGHELGHFVLNHVVKTLLAMSLLLLLGFGIVQWAMHRLLARFAASTGVSRIDDIAGLPLLMALFSVFLALATPAWNTLVRTNEVEADRFGLNLSREPLGFAEAQLRLVEYRKADPGPVEEFIFFHHPGTRSRIYDAMRWREAMGSP